MARTMIWMNSRLSGRLGNHWHETWEMLLLPGVSETIRLQFVLQTWTGASASLWRCPALDWETIAWGLGFLHRSRCLWSFKDGRFLWTSAFSCVHMSFWVFQDSFVQLPEPWCNESGVQWTACDAEWAYFAARMVLFLQFPLQIWNDWLLPCAM